MIINNNIAALNTHRQLSFNNTNVGKNLEKLSSGFKINRAGDDAAGLAISEKMRAQIKGLDMASKNAQDGISLIQTAEGALAETHSILQRMRELAVQSSNDTNMNEVDREAMQAEVNALLEEIDSIADRTEFNTQKLIDGKFSDKKFHIGANEGQSINVSIRAMDTKNIGLVSQEKVTAETVDASTLTAEELEAIGLKDFNLTNTAGTNIDVLKDSDDKIIAIKVNDGGALDGKYVGITDVKVGSSDDTDADTTNDQIVASDNAKEFKNFTVSAENIALTVDGKSFANTNVLTDGNDEVLAVEVDGKMYELADIKQDADGNLAVKDGAKEYQFAAGDNVADGGKVSITNQKDADKAIKTINDALNVVSTQRADLGAIQNRLEHTINNLGASSENLSAAESRIRDTDHMQVAA